MIEVDDAADLTLTSQLDGGTLTLKRDPLAQCHVHQETARRSVYANANTLQSVSRR